MKQCAGPAQVLSAFLAMLFVCFDAEATTNDLSFHFADDFSAEERDKLISWITEVHSGVEDLVGDYPIAINIRFNRVSASSPVPWAQTHRGRQQGVDFYVDPSYSIGELRNDWTAAHELSHLVLPFVGRGNAWFAEGFASFMQYQVMHAIGSLSEQEARDRYLVKLERSAEAFNLDRDRFVAATQTLRSTGQYPVMYWGGSVFFFRLNEALQTETDTSLISLLADYMACCRRNRASLNDLVSNLDALLPIPIVSREMQAFRDLRGFPPIDPAIISF